MTFLNRVSLSLAGLLALAATVAQPAIADVPFAEYGSKEAARVVGMGGRQAMYIYPVEFIQINDDNIAPREVMWLEPGRYEVAVRAVVKNPPRLTRGSMRIGDGQNRIELVLEAGKVYHVGLRYNTDNYRSPYSTVLYRVEDQK